MKFALCIGGLFLLVMSATAHAGANNKRVTVCMEDGIWAPYLFVQDGEPAGLHIGMVQHAFKAMPYDLSVVTLPWKRCLEWVRDGRADALMSAAYTKDRASYLMYPQDAPANGLSPERVMRVEFVVVSRKEAPEWNGRDTAMPVPVGVPSGHATAERLQARGLKVTHGLRYDDLFRMLARGRIGSIVIVNELADMYLAQQPYKGLLKKHTAPYENRTLFLPFSTRGQINAADARSIWHAIARVREDETLMLKLTTAAITQARDCFDHGDTCR